MNSFRILASIALLAVSLHGCRSARRVASPDHAMFAHCVWLGAVRTWTDSNRNGVWDASEAPLPGVTIRASGSPNRGGGTLTTNADGIVEVSDTDAPGICDGIRFKVVASTPNDYQATTRTEAVLANRDTVAFGFVRRGA